MLIEEKTVQSEVKYIGKFFSVEKHQVELQNGKIATRDIVKHTGAVAVLAVTTDEKVILVKQYRKGIEQFTLEIPAGKLDKSGENELEAATRELLEETGYISNAWTELATMAVSPAYVSEFITIYVAKDLVLTSEQQLDSDEFVDVVFVTKEEVETLLDKKAIVDAKTLYALTHWLYEKERGHGQ